MTSCTSSVYRSRFHHDAKATCREFNVQGLDRSLYLRGPGRRLAVDWCELSGLEPPTPALLAPLLGPGRFIGVDHDPTVIQVNRRSTQEHCVWVDGRVEDLLRKPALADRIGVLNLDTTLSWDGREVERLVASVAPFVLRQFDRLGEFYLMVNAGAWRPKVRRGTDHDLRQNIETSLSPVLGPLARTVRDEDVYRYAARDARYGEMVNVRLKIGFR